MGHPIGRGHLLHRFLLVLLVLNAYIISSVCAAPRHRPGSKLSSAPQIYSRDDSAFDSNDWDTLHNAYEAYVDTFFAPQGFPHDVPEGEKIDRTTYEYAEEDSCEMSKLVLGDKIGTGANAQVFRATLSVPHHQDQTVAAKRAADGDLMVNGAILQNGTRSDNVMKVLGYFRYGEEAAIIFMPVVGGGDLKGKIAQYQRDGQKAVNRAFKQVMEGVRAVHKANVIHGDLKPANVLLEGSTLKLTDFDNARKTGNSLVWNFGTDGYMAPGDANDKRLSLWKALITSGVDSEWVKADKVEELLKKNFSDLNDDMRTLLGTVLCEPESLFSLR
ncbi:hypothetical protein NUU61_008266 [Penicillium alfredii]|uniref:Protein kinase domain-containing protein n=1 Tax=Penicillium alfredii TaxID=1506179 RepID=A0A9W9ESA4_9EURO|nr:uncharacterized protein NUU61_008266 [Penicillium alfredii]KAJ5086959.1 hypothetical protein NUU61_008266 [Penicillium alfredii]